ncbi:MAG: Trk system potassium transporter TrkA [Bacteroidota bacterium]
MLVRVNSVGPLCIKPKCIKFKISGMKIIIIGSGEIGFHLSKLLSDEEHDVTVLDHDTAALRKLNENCDVLTVEGKATSMRALLAAGADQAHMIVAATSVDEVNMVVSMITKRLGAKRVIARIRNDELFNHGSPLKPSDIGIDVLIHPEQHVAAEIVRLIKRAAASDLVSIADDRLQLIGIRLDATSPLLGTTLEQYASHAVDVDFRVVAILRRGRTIIPEGSDSFRENDHIFIMAVKEDVPAVIASTGRKESRIKKIMIAGGTSIGTRVTEMLSRDKGDWRIKLIEPNSEKSLNLAGRLHNALILNGDPTDPDLLVSEGIADTDAFIAVTPDEESNIISCLMAKHLRVSKTVALVSKAEYIPMSQTIGLDAAVNKKLSVTNEIHRQIRQGQVISTYAPYGSEAEIMELRVSEKSRAAGKRIEELKLPKRSIIGGIVQNGNAVVATGQTLIKSGDHIVMFCFPEVLAEVTRYFTR